MSKFVTNNTELFANIAQDLQFTGYSIQTLDQELPALQALKSRLAEFDFNTFDEAGIGRKDDHQKHLLVDFLIEHLQCSDQNLYLQK